MTGDPATTFSMANADSPSGLDHRKPLLLSPASLGVVYGDIGTSPLYAVCECFALRYGFMEDPDISRFLARIRNSRLRLDTERLSYFVGRENLLPTPERGMALGREWLFARMSRNAQSATDFYKLPPEQVVEVGYRSSCRIAQEGLFR